MTEIVVASFSGGKDSTAMVLRMIEKREREWTRSSSATPGWSFQRCTTISQR